MSDGKFCPNCGTYLYPDSFGDIICNKCKNIIIKKTEDFSLEPYPQEYDSGIIELIKKGLYIKNEILKLIEINKKYNYEFITTYEAEAKINSIKQIINQMKEKIAVSVIRKYETSKNKIVYDRSGSRGIGYDIESYDEATQNYTYIESKYMSHYYSKFDLTEREYEFLRAIDFAEQIAPLYDSHSKDELNDKIRFELSKRWLYVVSKKGKYLLLYKINGINIKYGFSGDRFSIKNLESRSEIVRISLNEVFRDYFKVIDEFEKMVDKLMIYTKKELGRDTHVKFHKRRRRQKK